MQETEPLDSFLDLGDKGPKIKGLEKGFWFVPHFSGLGDSDGMRATRPPLQGTPLVMSSEAETSLASLVSRIE